MVGSLQTDLWVSSLLSPGTVSHVRWHMDQCLYLTSWLAWVITHTPMRFGKLAVAISYWVWRNHHTMYTVEVCFLWIDEIIHARNTWKKHTCIRYNKTLNMYYIWWVRSPQILAFLRVVVIFLHISFRDLVRGSDCDWIKLGIPGSWY